jgi:hypothetical protein
MSRATLVPNAVSASAPALLPLNRKRHQTITLK